MSGIFTGQQIIEKMIDGRLDSSELDALLGDDYYLAAFKKAYAQAQTYKLLSMNVTAFGTFIGSSVAFGILSPAQVLALFQGADIVTTICTYGQTLANILNDPTYYEDIRQDSTAYTNLKNRVNQTGSKLYADVLTSSGTFTHHTGNGLLGLSLSMAGGSGAGYQNNIGANQGGGGGSGSEFASKRIPVGSLPSSNTSYTIGIGGVMLTFTAPTASSFGAFLSADPGTNASDSNATNGGGATANSGYSNTLIDLDFSVAAWQGDSTETTIKGGDSGGQGVAGSAGWNGNGGGAAGINNTQGGRAGTSGGAGGGGGHAATNGNTTPCLGEASTVYYGAGGGGGNRSSTFNNYGGNGYQGVIRAMYVKSG